MKCLPLLVLMLVLPSATLAQMVIPRSAPLPVHAPQPEPESLPPETFTPPEAEPLFTRERTARGSSPERNALSNHPTIANAHLAFAMHTLRLWNTFEAVRLFEYARLKAEEAARAKLGPEPIAGMGRHMELFAQILKDYGIHVQRTELPPHYDLINLENPAHMTGVLQKLMHNPPLAEKMKQHLGSLADP
jgi:hypothetical protein